LKVKREEKTLRWKGGKRTETGEKVMTHWNQDLLQHNKKKYRKERGKREHGKDYW